jgi:peptidoglycan/LPS O-acetylase OafA/YrhL
MCFTTSDAVFEAEQARRACEGHAGVTVSKVTPVVVFVEPRGDGLEGGVGVNGTRDTYRPELDGLRALAFLAVFVAHVFHVSSGSIASSDAPTPADGAWWFRGVAHAGTFGVDLFFVLSGYLITSILLREETRTGRINLRAFWMRRVLRIWPAYFGLVALAAVFNGMSWSSMAAFATFTANLPIFDASVSGHPVNLHVLWTIQIEEQYYLFWPVLLVLTPSRYRLPMACGLVAMSVIVRAVLFLSGASLYTWILTPARLDALGVGGILALRPPTASRGVKALATASPLVAVIAAGLTLQALVPDMPGYLVRPSWVLVAIFVPFVTAVYFGAVLLAATGARWLASAPLVWIGRVSYGLYLIHMSVLQNLVFLPWPWSVLACFGATLVLAAISYRYLESPFLRLKTRFAHA